MLILAVIVLAVKFWLLTVPSLYIVSKRVLCTLHSLKSILYTLYSVCFCASLPALTAAFPGPHSARARAPRCPRSRSRSTRCRAATPSRQGCEQLGRPELTAGF